MAKNNGMMWRPDLGMEFDNTSGDVTNTNNNNNNSNNDGRRSNNEIKKKEKEAMNETMRINNNTLPMSSSAPSPSKLLNYGKSDTSTGSNGDDLVKISNANITCPDGSLICLKQHGNMDVENSTTSPGILIGRGLHGIPADEYSSHISRKACIVRIHSSTVQLIVIGSQSCRVNHSDGTHTVVTSPQNFNNCNGKTTLILKNDDVIEPYVRDGANGDIKKLVSAKRYFCFKVESIYTPLPMQHQQTIEMEKQLVVTTSTNSNTSDTTTITAAAIAKSITEDSNNDVVDPSTNGVSIAKKQTMDVQQRGKNNEVIPQEEKEEEEEVEKEEEEEEEEEYDGCDPREDIEDILSSIESPGTFAVGKSCNSGFLMPGLQVNGVGPISLPLSNTDATKLAEVCLQAPFGRGSKTIVDKKVRNTLQLSPEHFQISNPSWGVQLKKLVKNVCTDLGVAATITVEAQLYKMLLYEKGSFFKKHRDSEKVAGMFGTLIITLPSTFEGGELVVEHNKKTKEFNFAKDSAFSSHYMSFYADCQHELNVVTSGHRLCIVYNLVKTGGYGSTPSAGAISNILKQLRLASKAWGEDFNGSKMVYMLEHKYTPAGIRGSGSKKYKGTDAAIVELLELVDDEENIDLEWDHGTISFTETGYSCDDGGGYGYGRYSHYEPDFTWEETTDSSMSLKLQSWGNVTVDAEDEMIPPDYYENNNDYEETFEPTGNEGTNAERTYTDREAIVLWPRSQRWLIVTDNNLSRMVQFLTKAIQPGHRDSESLELCLSKAKIVAKRILKDCSGNSYMYSYSSRSNNAVVNSFVKIVSKLKDKEFALSQFLMPLIKSTKIIPHDAYFGSTLSELRSLLDCFGIEALRPIFSEMLSEERYKNEPGKTASFAILMWRYLRQDPKYLQFVDSLLNSFILLNMLKCSKESFGISTECKFPIQGLLAMFYGPQNISIGSNDGKWNKLSLNAIEALVGSFLSPCKKNHSSSRSYHIMATTTNTFTLKSFHGVGIGNVCNANGWVNHESCLKNIIITMCSKLKEVGIAAALLNEIASTLATDTEAIERDRICGELALVVTAEMMKNLPTPTSKFGEQVNLFKLVTRYCSSNFQKVIEHILKFDVDKIIVPFIDSIYKWLQEGKMLGNPIGASPAGKALSDITLYCANTLQTRLNVPIGFTQLYDFKIVPTINSSKINLTSFLKSPCKTQYITQLRKTDHKTTLAALRKVKGIRSSSFQVNGRGKWHIKVVKTRSTRTVSQGQKIVCDCNRSSYRNMQVGNCLAATHNSVAVKREADSKTLSTLKSYLPAEMLGKITAKRKLVNSNNTDVINLASSSTLSNSSGSGSNSNSNGARKKPVKKKPKKAIDINSVDVVDLT